MKKSNRPIFSSVITLLCLLRFGGSLAAAPLRANLGRTPIVAGEKAVISGQAVANARITVQITGPTSIAPGSATADAAGNYSLELGPFTAAGSYGLYVRAGIEQQLLVLEVQERATGSALTDAASQYTQALNRSVAAMESAVDRLTSEIGQFPRGDPDIARIERELPQLRASVVDLHRVVAQVVDLTPPLVFDLNEVQGVRPEARTEMTQFYGEEESQLRPAAEGLEQAGASMAAQNATDWCMRAVYAKQGIAALAAVVKILSGSVNRYVAGKLTSGAGATALEWFFGRFGEHMPDALRPLPETQASLIRNVQTGIAAVMPYAINPLAQPWATIATLAERAGNELLDAYMNRHCLTFRGRISGHVHVEALDRGIAFYGLDNDWTANATLTYAKPASDAPYPIKGFIDGRGKNFKADNRLYTIFPEALAAKLFLSTPPSMLSQAAAVFMGTLKGTIHGGKVSLNFERMQIDALDFLQAKMTAVVVPAGSQVPEVKTYNVPYQKAAFDVSRAFGPDGISLPITTELMPGGESHRRLQGTFSRNLSRGSADSMGARGTFTLKVDLCADCPASWEGEE